MKKDQDDEIEREIRTHLDLEVEERVADGMSETDARDAARRAFGNVTRTHEDVRAVWTRRWLDELVQDARYALRTLRKSPGFTLIAIFSLALAIGANTLVFSVLNALVLTPLPIDQPDRLVLDGKYVSLTESPRAVVFWPMRQVYNEATTVVVQSAIDEKQMAAQVREAITALDPALPLHGVGSAEQMLGLVLLPTRAAAVALSAFGLLALLLAATGIHGLLAYAVARRRREIGIRVAVGASPVDLLRLVLGRIAAMIAVGAVLGLLLAFAAAPLVAGIVPHASPRDPIVIGAVALVLILLGAASCAGPLRRTLRVDPLAALRTE